MSKKVRLDVFEISAIALVLRLSKKMLGPGKHTNEVAALAAKVEKFRKRGCPWRVNSGRHYVSSSGVM